MYKIQFIRYEWSARWSVIFLFGCTGWSWRWILKAKKGYRQEFARRWLYRRIYESNIEYSRNKNISNWLSFSSFRSVLRWKTINQHKKNDFFFDSSNFQFNEMELRESGKKIRIQMKVTVQLLYSLWQNPCRVKSCRYNKIQWLR